MTNPMTPNQIVQAALDRISQDAMRHGIGVGRFTVDGFSHVPLETWQLNPVFDDAIEGEFKVISR